MPEETTLVPLDTFLGVSVPWLMHTEKALKRDDFHRLMRAFKAFDPEGKGWVDAETLRAALMSKVCRV